MRVLSTNILVNHPAYQKILTQYNEELKRDGKVNDKQFFEKIILPEIPEYKMSSWYKFLKRFKTEAGIVAMSPTAPVVRGPAGEETALTLLTNSEATQKAVAMALNISADALKEILTNPQSMSAEKRAELFLKVMKAQDNRVKAFTGLRADNREQERFDRTFDNAAYG